ncbi:M48 family metallopeptidase [Viridibacterium curvum]|uniref:M48 family metallopeptidase n=1 Tax=Viridibacterium curvum TaxID=1101404 RepID=A0ABP9QG41_9RHOO
MRTGLNTFLLFAVMLMTTACQTVQTTQPGVVGVTRQQRIMGSLENESQQMNKESALAYTTTLQSAAKKGELNPDKAQTERVRAIANKLIPHVVVFRPEAKNWAWEVNVLASKDVNAWCMPGGKIAVFTGLIETLRVTDDELAAVMGHEISHALREHALERQPRVMAAQVGGVLLSVGSAALGFELPPELAQSASMAAIALPNSREQESEADRMGLELAARAGYDPSGAVTLWQKMAKLGGNAPPKILSSHPPSEERQADLKATVPLVMPLYEKARGR